MSWASAFIIAVAVLTGLAILGMVDSRLDKRAERRAVSGAAHTAAGREYAALKYRVEQARQWYLSNGRELYSGRAVAQRLDMVLLHAANDATVAPLPLDEPIVMGDDL